MVFNLKIHLSWLSACCLFWHNHVGKLGEVTHCRPLVNCLRPLQIDGVFPLLFGEKRGWALLLLHAQAQTLLPELSPGVQLCFCLLSLFLSVKKGEARGSRRFYSEFTINFSKTHFFHVQQYIKFCPNVH